MRELMDIRRDNGRNHSVIIDSRERISITGVLDVISFNDSEIEVNTDGGAMTIFGQNLHINKLNLDDGQLIVDGFIEGMEYVETQTTKGGMFSRLFK
jgi:sporulation protein YabP